MSLLEDSDFKQSMFPVLGFLMKTHGRNHFSKPEMSWRLERQKYKYVTGAYVDWVENPTITWSLDIVLNIIF